MFGRILSVLCLVLLPVLPSPAQSKNLEQILKRMEFAGKGFQSFQAKLSQKKYTAVLGEFDAPETGQFYYARGKDGSALLRQEITEPATRILTIKGGVATLYQPRIKTARVVNLGKNKDKAEYLALGLGQSPAKLEETFDISYKGAETVGKMPCSILVLKPKSATAAAYFSSITLWVREQSGLPIQQKLEEPNGDYLLVTFSEERLNLKLPDSLFDQKLPKGVDVQRFR